jgi:hypothetical protein
MIVSLEEKSDLSPLRKRAATLPYLASPPSYYQCALLVVSEGKPCRNSSVSTFLPFWLDERTGQHHHSERTGLGVSRSPLVELCCIRVHIGCGYSENPDEAVFLPATIRRLKDNGKRQVFTQLCSEAESSTDDQSRHEMPPQYGRDKRSATQGR